MSANSKRSFGLPFSRLLRGLWQRWHGDERGAELVEFAMLLPILVGLFWIIFEARQLSSLRDDLRTATAQAARFVTAYIVPPADEVYFPRLPYVPGTEPRTLEIRNRAEQIIRESLASKRGILGDVLIVRIDWYEILDPQIPDWRGNSIPLGSADPLANLGPNDHFAMRVQVDVPWRTILFGVGGSTQSDYNLTLVDTTVGATPDQPFCEFDISADAGGGSGGDCPLTICWDIDCSYQPRALAVYLNGELLDGGLISDPYSRCIDAGHIDAGGSVDVVGVLDPGTRFELEDPGGSPDCPGGTVP
jgi:hypothetical protein